MHFHIYHFKFLHGSLNTLARFNHPFLFHFPSHMKKFKKNQGEDFKIKIQRWYGGIILKKNRWEAHRQGYWHEFVARHDIYYA